MIQVICSVCGKGFKIAGADYTERIAANTQIICQQCPVPDPVPVPKKERSPRNWNKALRGWKPE